MYPVDRSSLYNPSKITSPSLADIPEFKVVTFLFLPTFFSRVLYSSG